MVELEARVGAVLRRTRQVHLATHGGMIEEGGIQFDTISDQIVVYGQPVELVSRSSTSFACL